MIFLRPYFLLLLLIPLLFWGRKKIKIYSTPWKYVCDSSLLPYLAVDVNAGVRRSYWWVFVLAWCLTSICLAGPAFEKENLPTGQMESGLVVVVDMSPVMDKKTTQKAIYKLYDLLDVAKDKTIGLVLADRKAYTALPLTQDKEILKNVISQLNENVMPDIGQNIEDGITLAERLLSQSGFPKGQILVLTAGVNDEKSLLQKIKRSPYEISVIGIGDRTQKTPVMLADGRFLDNGKLFGLAGLSSALREHYHKATLDDKDLQSLISNNYLEKMKKSDYKTTQYQDMGIWGVLLLVPCLILLSRKGVLLLWLICFSYSANASIWRRTEQEDYQNSLQAIEAFEDKNYETALIAFEELSQKDIEALYNKGTTLAFMGKIPQAIEVYEQVLSFQPSHQDARFNLEKLKQMLKKQQQQEQKDKQDKQTRQENNQQQEQQQSQQKDKQEKQQQEKTDSQSQNTQTENPSTEEKQNNSQEGKTQQSQEKTDSQSQNTQQEKSQQEEAQQQKSQQQNTQQEKSQPKEDQQQTQQNEQATDESNKKQQNNLQENAQQPKEQQSTQKDNNQQNKQQNQSQQAQSQQTQNGRQSSDEKTNAKVLSQKPQNTLQGSPDGDSHLAKVIVGEDQPQEWLDKIESDAGLVLRYRLKKKHQEQQ